MARPNGPPKGKVKKILDVLEQYRQHHPRAKIDAYRKNAWDIRVRIIDPDFAGIDLKERFDMAYLVLDQLPEEVFTDIAQLVLVTPTETKTSGSNLEYEDPIS